MRAGDKSDFSDGRRRSTEATRSPSPVPCLPESSRERLEFYFPGIAEVVKEVRQRFRRWGYFLRDKKEALTAVTCTILEQSLDKAARVLLDEAEVVGLRGGEDLKPRPDVTDRGDRKKALCKFRATMKGAEDPPRGTGSI